MSSIFINEYNLNFKIHIFKTYIFIYTHCSSAINFRTRNRIFACPHWTMYRYTYRRKRANETAIIRCLSQRHPFLNELLEGWSSATSRYTRLYSSIQRRNEKKDHGIRAANYNISKCNEWISLNESRSIIVVRSG